MRSELGNQELLGALRAEPEVSHESLMPAKLHELRCLLLA
jgi:hypothetical protein